MFDESSPVIWIQKPLNLHLGTGSKLLGAGDILNEQLGSLLLSATLEHTTERSRVFKIRFRSDRSIPEAAETGRWKADAMLARRHPFRNQFGIFFQLLRRSVLRVAKNVVGHLDKERFVGFRRVLHQRHSAFAHAKDVHRIGRHMRSRIPVAGIAVALVVAVVFWATARDVPFPKVSRAVSCRLENLASCRCPGILKKSVYSAQGIPEDEANQLSAPAASAFSNGGPR